ncbi:conserved protein of unknown function [uncultured Sphingopyxis sp.]|uniref:Uncharacterized protein n=1 Tax=uncultured Sphingopyxis sp. TaxID=310581 RepID=A0A1Y5Q5J7_9SPHN|nr:hypothetical protein [uncultured Sphingopyxis sp.]SBV35047.1 conserved protein of unknown function [uncultured Sphingopyxis sp.]
MNPNSAFFAFPGQQQDLVGTISSAAHLVSSGRVDLTTWPDMGIFGELIPDSVRENIRGNAKFLFDITVQNSNVYYEAGYAIGLGKPVAPVLNLSFSGAAAEIQRDGLFDNLGYKGYENSQELSEIIEDLPANSLIDLYSKELDAQQPLFILDTYRKTDFRNHIVSSIKAARIHYRSFDPVEVPRISLVSMIGQVTASSGLVLPLLADHVEDAARHNLRAAFLAGLGHGIGREVLLLQMRRFDAANPADFREMVVPVADEKAIADTVEKFAKVAFLASQQITSRPSHSQKTGLQALSLGSSAAENEFRTLSTYFVETAEYSRTLRGEVNVVAGRKGSGKTAIFFQARDAFRSDKAAIVTDLKPESHQLSQFRQELLKIVEVGTYDHTLAAFWYFLLLSEILLTMRRNFEFQSRFDSRALERLEEANRWLETFNIDETGDFTTRINRLGNHIMQEIEAAKGRRQAISADFLTNVIFRGGITQLKKFILDHSSSNEHFVLFFDNIDKGWPTNGVHEFDVRLVRLLIESLDKIKRDFAAAKREFMSVVFLRNDIYEMLVEKTPDRGKAGQVRIDWTDRAKLKQVIYRRLQVSSKSKGENFDKLWQKFFVANVGGQESFEFFVDHCLMRPRFLINIVENAISNAVNRGNSKVEEADCLDAVRQHSLYLVDDFGYEIRDVSGLSADILYSLVGVDKVLSKDQFLARFTSDGMTADEADNAFRLMLWYGVIGILTKSGNERFIYDYEYNMKRLEAESRQLGENASYVTNAALHVALQS